MYKKIKKTKLLWINNAINYLVYVDVFMITNTGRRGRSGLPKTAQLLPI